MLICCWHFPEGRARLTSRRILRLQRRVAGKLLGDLHFELVCVKYLF